jgi:AcrR family transcriptional regulator
MDSSKVIRRVGTFRSGLLVWVCVAVSVTLLASRWADSDDGRLFERFYQILYSVEMATVEIPAEQGAETKGAQTRRAILEAAITRFGRDGYRTTSVADIARDAGVGGTVAYAYFPNKEALFLAAVDEDAAGVIQEGLATVTNPADISRWHDTLIFTLVGSLGRHPLARRLLAGLEPEVTVRVLEMPALMELRKACTELLRTGQAVGMVRPDIDPVVVGNGVIALMLSVLMSVTQLGSQAAVAYSRDVAAVFEAALTSPVPRPDDSQGGGGDRPAG